LSLKDLRIKRIGDSFINILEPNQNILDIGCGDGSLGKYIESMIDINYYGVDVVVQNTKNDKIFTSNIPYPFKDKFFDIVILILTLHHFESPEKGFNEAIRLAKKKIVLLEDVPRNSLERNCMKIVDYVGNKIVSDDIPLPFNFYDDKKWKEIFNKNNLKLVNRKNVYPLPFPRLNHYLYEINI